MDVVDKDLTSPIPWLPRLIVLKCKSDHVTHEEELLKEEQVRARKWREHSQKRLWVKHILIMVDLCSWEQSKTVSRDGETREIDQRR